MPLPFDTVDIVDDNEAAREALIHPLEDAQLIPRPIEGPLGSLADFMESLQGGALLSDHQLQVSNYAHFNGAEAVAWAYKTGKAAILCTRCDRSKELEIRPFRRWIPVLISPEEVGPESLIHGFSLCLAELDGDFRSGRKPWRTLVRIEEVIHEGTEMGLHVVVPAWSPTKVVHLPFDGIPTDLPQAFHAGMRLHARVNVGAEFYDELYFEEWTVA